MLEPGHIAGIPHGYALHLQGPRHEYLQLTPELGDIVVAGHPKRGPVGRRSASSVRLNDLRALEDSGEP